MPRQVGLFNMDYILGDEEFQETIILIGGAIAILPIIIYLSYGRIGIEIFSVIVTSLLTFALVILYFQQYRILGKQTKLMHRDYASALVKKGSIIANDDTVQIKIRNAGQGKIRRMYLKCEVTSDTGDVDTGYGRVPIQSVENGSPEVEPESEWKDYEAEVRFRIPSIKNTDDDRVFPFKMLTHKISQEGIDSIVLKLTIEVIDEAIIEGDFSYTNNIAEQEVEVPGPVTQEIDDEEQTRHVSTSLEDSLGSDTYSSSRDINTMSLEELALAEELVGGSK